MTLQVNLTEELEPISRPAGAESKSPSRISDGDSVLVSLATWVEILGAIDQASKILTYQDTIAGQMEEVANSLVSLAEKLRKQAKDFRANREQLNAGLYPVATMMRGMVVKTGMVH